MTPVIYWLVISGALVALELLTGTVYLLLIAAGMAGGGLAAWLNAPLWMQIVVASLISVSTVFIWHRARGKRTGLNKSAAHLDVGEKVEVNAWSSDGTASVQYRGANWQAKAQGNLPLQAGVHRIVDVIGSVLILEVSGSSL